MKSMKKISAVAILTIACLRVACWCSVEKDDVFAVKADCYVPVFITQHPSLTYGIGTEGVICYDLDTVLLPGTIIRVIKPVDERNIRIEYFTSNTVTGIGFIHPDFLKTSMESLPTNLLGSMYARTPSPPPLREVRRILQRCIDENVPFCYGANNFEKIDLNGKYEFNRVGELSEQNGKYELRGFDCSGILHFISNGLLPHCTKGLDVYGKRIFVFSQRRYSAKEKKAVLTIMKDSDYVVFLHRSDKHEFSGSGHVLLFYNGGFLEFKWKEPNVFYTPREKALDKLDSVLKDAETAGSNLYIIRWHPELLQEDL
ncbi:MAG: hypothetical protein LBI61_02110 [Puniceicoccales bacterium]|jgi:hypothetical protein|nr:hypothetical protein [Puniceicoccales bacterium]